MQLLLCLLASTNVALARKSFGAEACYHTNRDGTHTMSYETTKQACDFLDHTNYNANDGYCYATRSYGILDECFNCMCNNIEDGSFSAAKPRTSWHGLNVGCGYGC
jgi:hypothetical protein